MKITPSANMMKRKCAQAVTDSGAMAINALIITACHVGSRERQLQRGRVEKRCLSDFFNWTLISTLLPGLV